MLSRKASSVCKRELPCNLVQLRRVVLEALSFVLQVSLGPEYDVLTIKPFYDLSGSSMTGLPYLSKNPSRDSNAGIKSR